MPESLNFKEIATSIDIEQVAQHLGLMLKRTPKDIRTSCPACESDERALQIFPESNSFRCHSAQISGDCIALYAHVRGYQGMYRAAKELSELFTAPAHAGQTVRTTSPQKPSATRTSVEASTAAPLARQKSEGFDPAAFEAKLIFNEEVAALGYTEETAAAFRVGFYRGHVYIPNIYPSGTIAGWSKLVDGKLVAPKQWVPDTSNVVQLKRPA